MVIMSKVGIVKPKKFSFNISIPPKSFSYEEAKGIPKWDMTIKVEFDTLMHSNTWIFFPKPKDCKPISLKWLYKVKLKSDHYFDKYKCKVVAKGYKQKFGIQYLNKNSLKVKPQTVKVVLTWALTSNWTLK